MKKNNLIESFKNFSGEVLFSVNHNAIDPFKFQVFFFIDGKIEKGFTFSKGNEAYRRFSSLVRDLQVADCCFFFNENKLAEIN